MGPAQDGPARFQGRTPVADTASTQTPEWNTQQKLAEKMVPLLGTLYREHNVVTSIYGLSLIHI